MNINNLYATEKYNCHKEDTNQVLWEPEKGMINSLKGDWEKFHQGKGINGWAGFSATV